MTDPTQPVSDDAVEPGPLRKLRVLVTVLMWVMIVGIVLIVGLMALRLSQPAPPALPALPALPAQIVLPAGATASAVTAGQGWYAVVTSAGRILIFDAQSGALRQEVNIGTP